MNQNELMHFGVKGMKWGHRKNYYGSSGDKYRASNGITVGAPKNAGVAAFRKVQGSKAGGAAINGIAKLNTAVSGSRNKTTMKRIEERTRKETDAVREANQAHKQAKKDAKVSYKQDKINIKKKAVSDYNKKFNSALRASNIADKKWNEVNEQYKALGKNKVERMINAMSKSEAAKQYSKNYDEASKLSDIADKKWKESKEAYKQTGRNYVNRIFNIVKYDPNK